MPRDYVHRVYSTTRSRRKPFSVVIALLLLVLITFFIVGLIHLKKKHHFDKLLTQHSVISSIPQIKPVSIDKRNDSKQLNSEANGEEQFQFYNMLPRLKVDVSDVPLDASTSEESKIIKRYILQIASFNHSEEAERLKDQLKRLGVEAYFSTVSRGDNTYYRVQAGPFDDESTAISVCDRIRLNNLDCIMITLKEM